MGAPTVFGDGSHPTTATSLALLDGLVGTEDRVLDVGCGAGALSISAALQGGAVTAIDIDPVAVQATADNAVRNDVAVTASTADLHEVDGPFEIVVANMTSGALEPLVPDLVRCCGSGGRLLLSGMLEDQWPTIRDAVSGRIEVVRIVDDWLTALLRR